MRNEHETVPSALVIFYFTQPPNIPDFPTQAPKPNCVSIAVDFLEQKR